MLSAGKTGHPPRDGAAFHTTPGKANANARILIEFIEALFLYSCAVSGDLAEK
jgi:hypothetical protein